MFLFHWKEIQFNNSPVTKETSSKSLSESEMYQPVYNHAKVCGKLHNALHKNK